MYTPHTDHTDMQKGKSNYFLLLFCFFFFGFFWVFDVVVADDDDLQIVISGPWTHLKSELTWLAAPQAI